MKVIKTTVFELCHKTFSTMQVWKHHFSAVHEGRKDYNCEEIKLNCNVGQSKIIYYNLYINTTFANHNLN